ncbi:MAG: 6-bladed beta-propeller [Bacteroidota bacterium]
MERLEAGRLRRATEWCACLCFLLCLALLQGACQSHKGKESAAVNDPLLKHVAESKTFDQIFEKERDLQLSAENDVLISRVLDVIVTRDSNILILDDIGRQVLMFSHDGEFIKKIGAFGHGPGEYLWPSLIAADPNGDIFVFDADAAKLLIFDAEGNFKSSIFTGEFVSRMAVTSHGVYLQEFTFNGRNSIYQYDTTGKLIRTFSPVPENFRELLMRVTLGGGLVADDEGNLYQITVAKYEISKFSPDGSLIAKFARTPPFLKPYPEKLPSIANDRRKLNELIFDRTLIHRLFYLKPGLLLVQLINHDRQRRPTVFLEIYDVSGRFLTGGIQTPFKRLVLSCSAGLICFLTKTPTDGRSNPTLTFYRLAKRLR